MSPDDAPLRDPESPPRKRRFTTQQLVTAAAVAVFLGGMAYMALTGAVTPESVRDWLDGLGPAAPILYVCAFILGLLVGLPGMAFVIGANLAFGPWAGFFLAYGGGLLAVTIPFVGTRALRTRDAAPWRPKNRYAALAFAKLETHPFLAVVVLRLILWFNAALTYALALSPIRTRVYVSACALALAPVVAAAGLIIAGFR